VSGEPGASDARLPDFFVVGHPKSGTTALYEMLRRHPQIYMPDGKEPWYFATELHDRPPPRPGGTPRTLAEYRALFAAAGAGQRVGEASALYLWSRTAAERIAAVRPDAQIVALVREPVSFLRSLHLQFVETYVEPENDFRTALALEDERRQGRRVPRHSYWPQALIYSDFVRYVEQLERYTALFGAERVLVLVYDDYVQDNAATVRRVLRFLDVDDAPPVEAIRANPTVHVRSQRLHHLVHAVSVGRGPLSVTVKEALKTVTPRPWRRRALASVKQRLVYGSARPLDAELTLELRARFKPQVVALGEYLGRDLVTLWDYGEIG
jgi:sulfotransferase family protein